MAFIYPLGSCAFVEVQIPDTGMNENVLPFLNHKHQPHVNANITFSLEEAKHD